MHPMIRAFTIIAIALYLGGIVRATPEDFNREYLPAGTRIGMTARELAVARPKALSAMKDLEGDGEFIEMLAEDKMRIAYRYGIRRGRVGAITRGFMITGASEEQMQQALNDVVARCDAFVLQRSEQIIRSTGDVNAIVTAELWEDSSNKRSVYLVGTNSEITVIVFDPKTFGKGDFFVGPERIREFDANLATVRRQIEKEKGNDRSVAIVDILPKAKRPGGAITSGNIVKGETTVQKSLSESVDRPSGALSGANVESSPSKGLSLWVWMAAFVLGGVTVYIILVRRR